MDKPAGTIRCGGRAWHPVEQRAITVREAATLQSYPYHYEFVGTVTDQYKQVGNAVPGRMARAIGLAIQESLRFVYQEEYDDVDDDKEEEEERAAAAADVVETVPAVSSGDDDDDADHDDDMNVDAKEKEEEETVEAT
jgi:hypothetical protein